ncbi:MAG: hypothetical protein ABIK67_07325 [candidate division WOR-3 bacterium]
MKQILVLFIFSVMLFAQVWSVRYNGPGNNRDEAHAIIVDSLYNVYITGYSPRNYGINYDYCTIKYNSLGIEQWVARYNGIGDSVDQARAIGLDESLNVYVTGRSWDWTTKSDIVTIKYNNQGEERWLRRYNGPANDEDQAYALAVSRQGDVYVGGYRTGIGTYWDYCLIKYNAQGESVWVATYNGTGNSNDVIWALAIDSIGNCYVTGYSGGLNTSLDIVTIKYNPDGETVWVRRYDGPAHDYDRGTGIAVNAAGEVWVTGYSLDTINQQDCITIKYNADGVEQWVARYDGPAHGYDLAKAIVIDANGNSFITGNSDGLTSHSDIITIKYDPTGNEEWVARYDGLANNIDVAEAIALDPFGNVCVAGHSQNIVSNNDYVTIKYNPVGETCWVVVFNYSANLDDEAFAITTDDSGYIYVTGYSMGVNSFRDYYTVKYYQGGLTNIERENVSNPNLRPQPKILPNPARNSVQVLTCTPVALFTVTGQLITTLKPGLNKISQLPSGVYFVKEGEKYSTKLLIY